MKTPFKAWLALSNHQKFPDFSAVQYWTTPKMKYAIPATTQPRVSDSVVRRDKLIHSCRRWWSRSPHDFPASMDTEPPGSFPGTSLRGNGTTAVCFKVAAPPPIARRLFPQRVARDGCCK